MKKALVTIHFINFPCFSDAFFHVFHAIHQIAFPPGIRFSTPDEQREYVKKWLIEDAHLPLAAEKLQINFYTAR